LKDADDNAGMDKKMPQEKVRMLMLNGANKTFVLIEFYPI